MVLDGFIDIIPERYADFIKFLRKKVILILGLV